MSGAPELPGGLEAAAALKLFSDTLRVTGVAHTGPEPRGDPDLIGKRLGLLNGSAWIGLWASFFGRMFLPGAHLVSAGNEAVQINFMTAHEAGQGELPPENVAAFERMALDLVELGHVDAVLITCSTMNRAYGRVRQVLSPHGVPLLQIDRPMMEAAVAHGGRILVVATHGPTVSSTQALLSEVAAEAGRHVDSSGALVEAAWHALSQGDVWAHNSILAQVIRERAKAEPLASAVLAQLSMSVFLLSYPDPVREFGIPVFTSGQCGFEAMRRVLTAHKGD